MLIRSKTTKQIRWRWTSSLQHIGAKLSEIHSCDSYLTYQLSTSSPCHAPSLHLILLLLHFGTQQKSRWMSPSIDVEIENAQSQVWAWYRQHQASCSIESTLLLKLLRNSAMETSLVKRIFCCGGGVDEAHTRLVWITHKTTQKRLAMPQFGLFGKYIWC